MSWLYRYEARGIQGYILASERLVEMACASDVVEHVGERARERLRATGDRGREVMVAAGSGTFVFDDEASLQSFAAEWPVELDERAPGLLVLQAWTEITDGHPAALARVLEQLEAQRNRPPVALPEAGPFVARASRTGRPAVARENGVLVDGATRAKLSRSGDKLHVRMHELFKERRPFATDLNQYGEGYLAVIHADGNGVGRKIVEDVSRRPLTEQQAFSQGLSQATVTAARHALQAISPGFPAKGDLPFRPLVVGGDDLTVITRAADAFRFTRAYLDHFEQATEATPAVGRLTAAAGICFVRSGHPFSAAHGIAEGLCQAAKRAGRGAAAESSLAFFRVTTSHAGTLDDLRRDELEFERGPLTDSERKAADAGTVTNFAGSFEAPPWTRARLDALDSLSAGLAVMPRGGLREWLRLAKLDVGRAQAHWERTLEVMRTGSTRSQHGAKVIKDACIALHGLEGPFDLDGRTTLLDAATWMAMGGGR
jgi:hypothetical protein